MRMKSSALGRLWTLVKVERRHLRRGLFFQFFQVTSYIPFYAAVSFLIDRILNNDALAFGQKVKWLGIYALGNLLLWPLHAWFTVCAFAETQRLVRSTVARLRRMVVDQLQRMSMSYFARRGAGALSNQMTVDLAKVESFLASVVNQTATQFLIGLATLFYLVIKNPWLALLSLVAVPAQIVLLQRMKSRVNKASQGVQKSGEVFAARIVEFIAGMRLTRSMGNELYAAERIGRDIEELKERGYEASLVLRWLSLGLQLIWEYTGTLVWCAGGLMYLRGLVSLGDLVAFAGLSNFVRQGMMAFFNLYEGWSHARPGLMAIIELLESDELEAYQAVETRADIKGGIEFKGVSFAYPRAEGTLVLRDLDIRIPPGQRVGLVGETGAGKTTFLELVMGFYRPTSGEILYDGLRLPQIGLRRLRRAIAIMSQDPFIWNTTVMENIRYGRPDATDAEVMAAARKAQAHEFILKLDEGYLTECGERGGKLSGGQRQRMALARLFLRDPRIVILDEPTSSLDLETESRLLQDMEEFCRGRTQFVVAHRLSTVRHADRILAFRDGMIVEDGPPAELLARPDGYLRRLYDLQASGSSASAGAGEAPRRRRSFIGISS